MAYCQDVFHAGHTNVILANNGKYLSRIHHSGVDYIEAEKVSIDWPSYFCASVLGDGKISLRANDEENNYVSRVNRSGLNNIEAAKTSIDVACEFQVKIDESGVSQWNGAHYIYIKANDGKY